MPIEIKESKGVTGKEVTFRVEEKGIVSRLYGSLEHDKKEIDKLVRTEKWDL